MRRRLALIVTLAVGLLGAPALAAPTTGTASAAPALPRLHNLSHLSDARAAALAAEALAGLGFAPGAVDGPQPNDRVFVGNRYIAWLDETGFYGELNGLWWLSPTTSGDLSFTRRDTDGRPVNQLVVGENGDGAWPPGYRGAEHIEMPNGTPEPGDDPSCALAGNWCDQYSLDEAGSFTQPGLWWWKACDPGALAYGDHVDPIEVTATADTLRLVYEAPLHKRAEGQFPWKGTDCHADWLFPDGVRRPVYLRVGFELSASEPRLDRLMQVRNPVGNPDFGGPFSFIGGFEITSWPSPRPDKAINRFLRPEQRDVPDAYRGGVLTGGAWNPGFDAPIGKDVIFAWLAQPISLSDTPAYGNARSLRLENVGVSDNLDVGICLCQAHGAIELGGGLLHTKPATDAALPVPGGATSIEARRRLSTAAPTVIADVPAWVPPTTTSTTSAPPTTATAAPTSTTATARAGGSPAVPAVVVPRFTG